MDDYRILHGDALTILRTLPTGSVHCVVTSPPYYGLRDYGTATWIGGDPTCDHRAPSRFDYALTPGLGPTGSQTQASNAASEQIAQYRQTCGKCGATRQDDQIGLEPTVDAYVARLVEVFEQVRRVLRDDGTLWLNLGDSYNGSGSAGGDYGANGLRAGQPKYPGRNEANLKPKDLMMVPARVALALQAAGWWLRADIIWAKRAPMPESVTDRPTRSHEHVFLLTKASRYYYDSEAVKEKALQPDGMPRLTGQHKADADGFTTNGTGNSSLGTNQGASCRNQRDVWLLGPEPFPGSHFAVMPTEIPRRAILAGTSERGCCPKCGAPWERVVEKPKEPDEFRNRGSGAKMDFHSRQVGSGQKLQDWYNQHPATTTGWRPTCACGAPDDWQADDLEVIASPTGERVADDPTMQTGRNGYNRPRGDNEGQRPITRYEQRHYAEQLRKSPWRERMAAEAGSAFAHYLRTDRNGARPVPDDLLEKWIERELLERVTVPEWEPLPPIPCTVLDPFGGSGTTAAVAVGMGRRAILIELNVAYIELQRERIEKVQRPLLTVVP